MSRKWRNILIAVLVIGAIVALFLLLPKGPDNYYDKYKDTYAAYQKTYADSSRTSGNVVVDVSAFSYNEEMEIELQKEKEAQAQKEKEEQERQESEETADDNGEAEALDGTEDAQETSSEETEGTEIASDVSSDETPEASSPEPAEGEGADQEENPADPEDLPSDDQILADAGNEDDTAASDPSIPNKLEMTWKVNVPKAGLYNIIVNYELENTDVAERSVLINSESPFDEAKTIEFYQEGDKITVDENGIRTVACRDDLGDYPSPYVFMFKEGENTITFTATDKKRMTVRGMTLVPPSGDTTGTEGIISYASYLDALGDKDKPEKGAIVTIDPVEVIDENGATADASQYKIDIGKYYEDMARRAAENGEEVDISAYYKAKEEANQTDALFYQEGILTEDGSAVKWEVNVEQDGLYNIQMDYLTVKSRGIDIERKIRIGLPEDGGPESNAVSEEAKALDDVPFSGADTLTFSRLWKDKGKVEEDNQGNQRRPSQEEIYGKVQRVKFKDSLGYETEPYSFYFKKGINYITLEAVNEPVIVCNLQLTPIAQYPTYDVYLSEVQSENPNVAMTETGRNYVQKVQGESAVLRSSPSLYARYDRSSSETDPYDVSRTILNYIGGDPWTHPGEWIQWDFEVPEDGYYNISIKARQMYQRGALSARTIYIDEKVPFDAMKAITFGYNTSWEMRTLADADGNPYRFFLKAGSHTLRMEVTMGQMGPVLNDVKESIDRLNSIYLKILVLTGATPDRFRDYNLAKVYPDAIRRMERESKRLYKIVDDIVSITGQKSDRAAVAQTLAIQLETFVESNERITESFSNFKDNITSLGTAMQNMSESKLDIDLIMITGDENIKAVPEVRDNFFKSAAHEIRSCVSSFFVDYNSLGDKYEDTDDVLEVWITTGRDQSTVLKAMVDDTFTKQTGIKVNIKLVQADAILTAVVAGNGPDVVMTVSGWFAVNYAMRNAVEDLTQFEEFSKVIEDFQPSILQPLTYDNGTKVGVYGLPETMNFNVLFYRQDVMEKYGLKIPETWDELISELPTIQGHSLTVAVPFPDIAVADISVLNSLIYQNQQAVYQEEAAIYDKDAKHTVIAEEPGVGAFKKYTSLYNDYGLPVVYDFVSRFRSGEMPLGIASYATFNTLMVSAPEIRGRWNFTLFPGTVKQDKNGTPILDENGNPVIDHTVQTDGLCCMMVATDDEKTKQNAWEYMKWWVSKDAQVRFGREMESILGASARYQTANIKALQELAWSRDQLQVLLKQIEQTRGFPEIAGGYSTTRHITNAIRRVINTKEDPRETLLNYARTINEEIKIKRKEFGLPID